MEEKPWAVCSCWNKILPAKPLSPWWDQSSFSTSRLVCEPHRSYSIICFYSDLCTHLSQVKKTLPYCPPYGLRWRCGEEETSSSLDAMKLTLCHSASWHQHREGKVPQHHEYGWKQAPCMISTDTMRRGAHFPLEMKVIVPHAVFSHNPPESDDGCLITIKWGCRIHTLNSAFVGMLEVELCFILLC